LWYEEKFRLLRELWLIKQTLRTVCQYILILMQKAWKLFPFVLLSFISITLVLLVLKANGILQIYSGILLTFRILSVILLIIYALRKRSLTTWILVCMIAGAEFGYDVPEVAKKLQVFSDIFLRMIKTIIAPLSFFQLWSWVLPDMQISNRSEEWDGNHFYTSKLYLL